jgi:hypothetical protein
MRKPAARRAHEVVQHRPCAFEVGHDAIDEGRDHSYIACLASLHLVCFVADGDNFTRDFINGND